MSRSETGTFRSILFVFAAALQENGAARVLGEQTFGKGLVQIVEALPGGGALKLACALAARCHDAHTRAASIETIAAAAEDPETCWRLVGLGALRSLTLAAAVPDTPGQPPVAQLAQRAAQIFHEMKMSDSKAAGRLQSLTRAFIARQKLRRRG